MFALANFFVMLYMAWACFFLIFYAITGNIGGAGLMVLLGGIVLFPWRAYKKKRRQRKEQEEASCGTS